MCSTKRTPEARRNISAGLRRYWRSPEGRAQRAQRAAIARELRRQRRAERSKS